MKKISLLLCAMLIIAGAFAQRPPPGHDGGPPGRDGSAPASGHLYGKLVDSAGHGIGKVSVMILKVYTDPATGKRKDQLLKGVASQNNGDFSAEDLPMNTPLRLNISAVGYQALTQDVKLTPPSSDKDLGDLHLVPDAKELQQVVVTASKPAIRMDSLIKVLFADIIWIEGSGDYVKIHLKSAPKPLLVRTSARTLEAELPKDRFIRIHKSYILSVDSITAVRKNSVFIGDLELPVGETYRGAVRQLTGKNL